MDVFTSPSALIRVVSISFPVPHEAWLFHSKSDGGLCATPASADHTCIHTVRFSYHDIKKNLLLTELQNIIFNICSTLFSPVFMVQQQLMEGVAKIMTWGFHTLS